MMGLSISRKIITIVHQNNKHNMKKLFIILSVSFLSSCFPKCEKGHYHYVIYLKDGGTINARHVAFTNGALEILPPCGEGDKVYFLSSSEYVKVVSK